MAEITPTDATPTAPPEGWWQEAFPRTANASERRGHGRGDPRMLTIIAYDISCPKRLRKVANYCEDHGVRVQYSIFECRLQADRFERFWAELCKLLDPDEDRLVAYPIHGANRHKVKTYGTMLPTAPAISYIF